MKSLSLISLAFVLFLLNVSCKKNSDDTNSAVNWTNKLKGSTWSGEFSYTSGISKLPQPFSIDLNADGTLTWTDLTSTRPAGTWAVDSTKITITFPNNTTLLASLHDGYWDNFSNPAVNGFNVENLFIGTHAEAAKLSGTSWSGVLAGSSIVTTFLPNSMMQINLGSTVFYSGPYTIEGAGIRFTKTGTVSFSDFFASFINNSILKGIGKEIFLGKTTYYNWNGQLVK